VLTVDGAQVSGEVERVDPSGRTPLLGTGDHHARPPASTLIQPLLQAATFGQHAREVARGQYWIHPAPAEVAENALRSLEPNPTHPG
jgi:hypothetical protein